MDRSWRRWVALSLALGVLQVVTPAAPSLAKDCRDRGSNRYVPVTGAVFNDPTGEVSEQYRIISTLVKNIDGTPPGGDIRVATVAITAKSVVTALTAAHRCRVHVRVVVPERAWEDRAVVSLREALGSDVTSTSYVTHCDGSCTTEGPRGLMHAKVFLFSQVQGAEHVTVYSSSNLTGGQARTRWNDAFQLVGDEVVYSSAAAYFDQLRLDTDVDFPRLTKAAGYWQYYFPSPREFHLDLLGKTGCRTPSGATTIELAASIWTDGAVAEKVADLHDAGCDVRVVLSLDKTEQEVLRTLLRREVPTRVRSADEGVATTHSKYVAIRGRHDGYLVRTVYSGAVNVSGFSTHIADNTMIRVVDDKPIHAAYRRNFEQVWESSRPLRRADVVAALSS